MSLNTFRKGTDIKMAHTRSMKVVYKSELMDSSIFGRIMPAEIESVNAIAPNS